MITNMNISQIVSDLILSINDKFAYKPKTHEAARSLTYFIQDKFRIFIEYREVHVPTLFSELTKAMEGSDPFFLDSLNEAYNNTYKVPPSYQKEEEEE